MAIPPGTYTPETLPPISPEAQAILDRAKKGAKELAKEPKFQEIKSRLLDLNTGQIDPDVLGEALGATGYPRPKKK
jgi:hypothetical protein